MRSIVLLLLLLLPAGCLPGGGASSDRARWEERAERVTITRDEWGIPHIYGETDADVVFGLMYAQAEDDFPRIETNYLNALGRLAEAEGESALWRDLRMKLFIDPAELQRLYGESPPWLQEVMDAWADGLNFYLDTHPDVRPRVIGRFEPWMALSFSEGSIGGDIERVSLQELERFHMGAEEALAEASGEGGSPARRPGAPAAEGTPAHRGRPDPRMALGGVPPEPTGSNGIAIAPSNTTSGNALFLINPHTSFFFRAEARVSSGEGLNAYGALTWGQFFIYQGFNDRLGWMHTSSSVDNIDEYVLDVVERDGAWFYRHGGVERPMESRTVTVPYRTDAGMAELTFTVHRTHQGPVVRRDADGRWVAVALMEKPLEALTQSYQRTKARTLDEFRATMELHTNSSNNTVYADADGNIAYFHANFVPRRDPSFDWSRPVDGSDPATDWGPPHAVEGSPLILNPASGWIQNTNNPPWTGAGAFSPSASDFPPYMDTGAENPRGIHAIRVLDGRRDFTLESLLAAAYDSQLPGLEPIVPQLLRAWERLPTADPRRARLEGAIEALRGWDFRFSAESIPTTIAVLWGDELWRIGSGDPERQGGPLYPWMEEGMTDAQRITALERVVARLEADFGGWEVPWGEINRFQRLTGDIRSTFDDARPSLPVAFASGRWGSLASFGTVRPEGSKRQYGTSGNSFVAVVEFGDPLRAVAISAGGQSGDPESPHFNDQAERYSTGELREVHFHRAQLDRHRVREYRPGDR